MLIERLQCGPGSLAGENGCHDVFPDTDCNCFNAAPARSPGRTFVCPDGQEEGFACASMRPRLARRGELLFVPTAKKRASPALQCGPGSLAGENRGTNEGCRLSREASMRPRLARRGELARRRNNCAGVTSFNAAPARSPGRTLALVLRLLHQQPASMRPRLARRGEPVPLLGVLCVAIRLQCRSE